MSLEPWVINVFIFIAGAIFSAGGVLYAQRKDNAQFKIDLSRLGTKSRDEERANLRRHFNICLMLIAQEEDREKRFRIAGQLKED